jgi:hypothetical protein
VSDGRPARDVTIVTLVGISQKKRNPLLQKLILKPIGVGVVHSETGGREFGTNKF